MRVAVALVLLLVGAGAAGCATVRPWERGDLVSRCMQETLDPSEAAWTEHVLANREAVRGAGQGGGASCGCN